jgi:hypothetical protein
MKYVKMLGLAAVAAAALMAFVGASTASATVICGTAGTGSPTGTTCPAGWAYGAKTPIHAVNKGTVTLDTSFKTVECTSSTVGGETSNEGSATETVTGPEGTLSFSGCNCPTVTVIKAGTIEIHWIEGTHNGTLTSSGSKVTTICKAPIFGFNVHCTYVTSKTDLGTLTGGNPATFTASASIPVEEAESDSLCPEESKWTATYEVTNPKPLFVTGHT